MAASEGSVSPLPPTCHRLFLILMVTLTLYLSGANRDDLRADCHRPALLYGKVQAGNQRLGFQHQYPPLPGISEGEEYKKPYREPPREDLQYSINSRTSCFVSMMPKWPSRRRSASKFASLANESRYCVSSDNNSEWIGPWTSCPKRIN